MRTRLARYLAFCAVFFACSAASAQSWDPFPSLNGSQHAGIIKRYDSSRYDDLRRCLRRFDSRVGAEYYAALVDITDEAGSRSKKKSNATPYAEALSQEWASSPGIDLDKHVVIVLGIQNRSLGIDVGSEWERVGFTGETVSDTVEASEYGRLMRRRNYGEAICALATAIDFRLAALRQSMERRIEEVGATFPEVEKSLTELQARADEAFAGDPAYAEGVRERLKRAAEALESAKENLEKNPAISVQKVDLARDEMASAEEEIERYIEEVERLDTISSEIDELQATIASRDDADWSGPTEALTMLEECRDKVAAIRDTLEGEPEAVRACLAEVRGKLAAADVRHDYLAGTIPTIFALFFLFVLVALIIVLIVMRRRTLRLLDPDIAEWERRLGMAKERAAALLDRYPDYFQAGDVAWEGESAALDAKTADAVNRSFFLLDSGERTLKTARDYRKKGHPLSVFPPQKAGKILRETETTLPAGTVVESSPLDVPTTQNYTQPSARLTGDLHDSLLASEELLAESAHILERLARARAAGDAAESETVAAVEQRRALKLPADHLLGPLQEARQRWAEAKSFTHRDPLGSDRDNVLGEASETLEALRDRAVGGNEAVAFVRGPLSQRLNAIKHALAQLQGDGFELKEPNFDARAELQAISADAKRALERMGQGDERRAIPAVDELDARSQDLERRVGVMHEARELVPKMANKLDELREAVRADILKLRIGIGKLEDGVVPKKDLDELMAFQTTLGRVNGELSRLKKSHDQQNYLAAIAHVHRLIALMERGVTLVGKLARMSGVELQSTPDEVRWPDEWETSESSSWESSEFGGSKTSKKLF